MIVFYLFIIYNLRTPIVARGQKDRYFSFPLLLMGTIYEEYKNETKKDYNF